MVAGREGPLYGLEGDRWIEVGWTSDPHSLISASDIFVLPNRETYFDLILLEVMSLGLPIVLSKTGGNKYFSSFKCSGLMQYESIEEAKNIILFLKEQDKCYMNRIGNENRVLFETEFTDDKFAQRYIEVLREILEEKNDF